MKPVPYSASDMLLVFGNLLRNLPDHALQPELRKLMVQACRFRDPQSLDAVESWVRDRVPGVGRGDGPMPPPPVITGKTPKPTRH